jgi:hypothetical protein
MSGCGIFIRQMRRSFLIVFGAVMFGICGTVPHLAFAYGEHGPFWSDLETRMLMFAPPPTHSSMATAVTILFLLWMSAGIAVDSIILALPFAKRAPSGMQWVLVTVAPPLLLAVLFLIDPFDRTF